MILGLETAGLAPSCSASGPQEGDTLYSQVRGSHPGESQFLPNFKPQTAGLPQQLYGGLEEAESTSPAWGTPHAGTPAVRTHAPPPAISHRSTSQLDLENPSWRLLGPELRQNHVNATVSPIRCQAGGCPGTLASHRRVWQDCSLHHPQPAFHAPQRQGATLRGMLKPELGTEDLGNLGGRCRRSGVH